MLLLSTTGSILQVVTGGTQAVYVHASWVDDQAGTAYLPGDENTAITTATTTTVVASPPLSTTQRNIKNLIIRNTDASVADSITVQHFDGTTTAPLQKVSLPAQYSYIYEDSVGWYMTDSTGNRLTSATAAQFYAPTGLTGATSASRYVGATPSGYPLSGTFAVGDYVISQNGQTWICIAAGSPGTWLPDSTPGGGFYNVQNFGIMPGNAGSTNLVAMGALISLATSGSEIYFPPGTYQFSNAIAVGAKAFIFQGSGQNSTVIQTTSTTADIFTLTDGNWYTEFRDIQFSTSVAKTAGNAITTGTASGSGNVGINVRRCTFSGSSGSLTLFNGIVYAGSNSGNVTNVEDCSFSNFNNYGIYIEGNTSTPTTSANIQISAVLMNGTLTSGSALAGIYFLQCGSAQVSNCDIIGCTNNLLMGGSSATSSGVFSVDCTNCYFDNSAGTCMLFQGTCNIERSSFVNCWFTTAAASGLSAIQSTNTSTIGLTGISFFGCQVYNTYGTTGASYGFNVTGAQDVLLVGCVVAGWSTGFSVTSYSAANYTSVKILDCTIGPVGNIGSNTTGVLINSGSFAYKDIIIANNDLAGNTIPMSNLATGWTSLFIGAQPGLANPSVPNVVASAAINTTATYVTPATPIPAGALQVGSTYRIVLYGTCTSTAANVSTFVLRIGTAGTTADTAVASITCTAATSGTAISFKAEFYLTVRTTGGAGTCWGAGDITNTGITGISSNGVGGGESTTAATVNTTVKNFIGVSYSSAATTTTSTFQMAIVEVVKA